MRKVFTLVLLSVLFVGCSSQNEELDRIMEFRAALLSGMGCQFQAVITADYQTEAYQFTMDCRSDEDGNMHFTVMEPESISGISGTISNEKGKLIFNNEHALVFEMLADGQVTPVTAPWLLVKTLRSGYVTSCGNEDGLMRVSIDDTFDDNALRVDVWFPDGNVPAHAEILWDNRRILSLDVTKFEIM